MPINLPNREALRREFDAAVTKLDEDRHANSPDAIGLTTEFYRRIGDSGLTLLTSRYRTARRPPW
jgi:hypothetical protein